MIDPNNIIDFNRCDEEKEELILFLVCVAGKKASTVVRQLDRFLGRRTFSPFTHIKLLAGTTRYDFTQGTKTSMLRRALENCRMGQYNKLEKAFLQLASSKMDLSNCSLAELMSIHGVGRKSASCFLAWTRSNVRVAMLDTHLLKFLREVQELNQDRFIEYRDVKIPRSTPSSKKLYDKLEAFYLDICDSLDTNPTEYDLHLWKHYSSSREPYLKGNKIC